MKHSFLYISILALCACSGSEENLIPENQEGTPISFSVTAQAEDEVATRASYTPLEQDFYVFGFKKTSGTSQIVFDGYKVSYVGKDAMTGLSPYSYVGGKSFYDVTQDQKFWDYSASEYRFWAFLKSDMDVSVSSDRRQITIGSDATPIKEMETFYTSECTSIPAADYQKVVNLTFKRLCSKIELKFFTNVPLTTKADDVIHLTGISLVPDNGSKISVSGPIHIEYPLTGDTQEKITWPEGTLQDMKFNNVEVSYENSTSATANTAKPSTPTGLDANVYTVYPMSSTTSFTLHLQREGEGKTAVLPAEYTQWKPNYKYVYIFKVDRDGIPLLYDVTVEPWIKGGELDLEFKNW